MTTNFPTTVLTGDTVENPEYYRALLRISPRDVVAAVFSDRIQGSLMLSAAGFESESSLRALEDFNFANPLLLTPLSPTTVVFETPYYMVIPSETSADLYSAMLSAMFPEAPAELVPLAWRIPDSADVILYGVDSRLADYVNRSYSYPRLLPSIAPLISFFLANFRAEEPAGRRVFVHLRDGAADIIAAAGQTIEIVNSFRCDSADDMAYYILAVAKSRNEEAGIIICGSSPLKRAILIRLREFMASVQPAVFPATLFRYGKNALKAPFDLMLAAL